MNNTHLHQPQSLSTSSACTALFDKLSTHSQMLVPWIPTPSFDTPSDAAQLLKAAANTNIHAGQLPQQVRAAIAFNTSTNRSSRKQAPSLWHQTRPHGCIPHSWCALQTHMRKHQIHAQCKRRTSCFPSANSVAQRPNPFCLHLHAVDTKEQRQYWQL